MGYFTDVSLGGPGPALIGHATKEKKSDGAGQREVIVGVLNRKTICIWNLTGEADKESQPVKIPGWQVPILYRQLVAILFPEGDPEQGPGPCKFFGERDIRPPTQPT